MQFDNSIYYNNIKIDRYCLFKKFDVQHIEKQVQFLAKFQILLLQNTFLE